jgi:hypothetical protein
MPQDKPATKKPTSTVKLKVENSMPSGPGYGITESSSILGDHFSFVGGKRYFPFLGSLDYLPTLLLNARLSSVTQNSCISAIAEGVIGKGLSIKDISNPLPDLLKWFECINTTRQSFDELLTNSVDHERGFGNIFIEVKKVTVGKKVFLKLYSHSILNCRLMDNGDGSEPTSVIISRLFAKVGLTYLRNPVVIPLYSDNPIDSKDCWSKNIDGSESTMLHFKNEVGGLDWYGLPDSVSTYRYQLEESKLVQYNIDNLDNNMVLGGMLILKSAMTRQEAEEQAQEILLTHIGEGKTGRIAVISSESGLEDVKFEQFNTQKEGSFKDREDTLERKIIMGNRYHAGLLGIDNEKALGRGSSYIRGIYDAVEAQLLIPIRTKLISKLVKPIVAIYASTYNKPELNDYNFTFRSAMPYSLLADLDPNLFTTVNEARQLTGKLPDEKNGNKYLAEINKGSDVSPKPSTP